MCMYTYIYDNLCFCFQFCICMYVQACTPAYGHTHTRVYISAHVQIYMHTYNCIFLHGRPCSEAFKFSWASSHGLLKGSLRKRASGARGESTPSSWIYCRGLNNSQYHGLIHRLYIYICICICMYTALYIKLHVNEYIENAYVYTCNYTQNYAPWCQLVTTSAV